MHSDLLQAALQGGVVSQLQDPVGWRSFAGHWDELWCFAHNHLLLVSSCPPMMMIGLWGSSALCGQRDYPVQAQDIAVGGLNLA